MKFGICLPIRIDASAEDNIDIARTAEALGFDSVWVSDHVVMPERHRGTFSDVFHDPFVLLSCLAAETERITLGTSVIILPYRNPVVVAKMVSTLDNLSEGRVIFGVGPGWMKEEYEALGIEYSRRGSRTDEYIGAIKTLWTEDDPVFEGEYCSFKDVKFEPKPYRKPHPPVWVAGSSEYALKRAAAYGDGWQPTWVSPSDVQSGAAKIKEISGENGRSLRNFIISARNRVKISQSDDAAERSSNSPFTLFGAADELIESVLEYEKAGVSHFVIDPDIEELEEIYQLMDIFSNEIMPELKV